MLKEAIKKPNLTKLLSDLTASLIPEKLTDISKETRLAGFWLFLAFGLGLLMLGFGRIRLVLMLVFMPFMRMLSRVLFGPLLGLLLGLFHLDLFFGEF